MKCNDVCLDLSKASWRMTTPITSKGLSPVVTNIVLEYKV